MASAVPEGFAVRLDDRRERLADVGLAEVTTPAGLSIDVGGAACDPLELHPCLLSVLVGSPSDQGRVQHRPPDLDCGPEIVVDESTVDMAGANQVSDPFPEVADLLDLLGRIARLGAVAVGREDGDPTPEHRLGVPIAQEA